MAHIVIVGACIGGVPAAFEFCKISPTSNRDNASLEESLAQPRPARALVTF